MSRLLFATALLLATALLTVIVVGDSRSARAQAKGGPKTLSTLEKVARADIVVIGKVTDIEKETILAYPVVRAKDKQPLKVAVIKIEKRLIGAEKLTHIKAAFLEPLPPADPAAKPRPGFPRRVELKKDQEGVFFLTKHASGDFYTVLNPMVPLDPTAKLYPEQVKIATKAVAVLADPIKALKANSAEERYFAASVLIARYRGRPFDGRETEAVPIAADESRLILKALTEADWRYRKRIVETDPPDPWSMYASIGLTGEDGWRRPQAQLGEDLRIATREEFKKWLDGAGKDYRIKKLVPKK